MTDNKPPTIQSILRNIDIPSLADEAEHVATPWDAGELWYPVMIFIDHSGRRCVEVKDKAFATRQNCEEFIAANCTRDGLWKFVPMEYDSLPHTTPEQKHKILLSYRFAYQAHEVALRHIK